jgi:hypothetical protein
MCLSDPNSIINDAFCFKEKLKRESHINIHVTASAHLSNTLKYLSGKRVPSSWETSQSNSVAINACSI